MIMHMKLLALILISVPYGWADGAWLRGEFSINLVKKSPSPPHEDVIHLGPASPPTAAPLPPPPPLYCVYPSPPKPTLPAPLPPSSPPVAPGGSPPPPAFPAPPPREAQPSLWCVANPTVANAMLQPAMDYACASGADCDMTAPGGPCHLPNTLMAHASYAFNSYWQRTKVAGGTCDFDGAAILITKDPSYDGCHYVYM